MSSSVIRTQKGEAIVVDAEDVAELSKSTWRITANGYALRTGGGPSSLMHRKITAAPSGTHVDHVDGDKLNNRKSNLRVFSASQNAMNRGAQRNNRLGLKGVYEQRPGRFLAQLRAYGQSHYLGYFDTPQEAHAAYLAKAVEVHGSFFHQPKDLHEQTATH